MSDVVRWIFSADGRSVTTTLDKIAKTSEKTGQQVKRDANENSANFEKVGKSAERLRGIVSGLAGTIGFSGLAFGIKDAVQGALQLQAGQTQIGNSLAAIGVKGAQARSTIESITRASEDLSQRGGGSTEEMVAGMAKLIGVTRSESAAQRAQRAAVGLSIKTGMDYTSALQLIISAEAGRVKGIQKYIGIVTPATQATQALADQVGKHTKAQLAEAAAANKALTAQQVISRVLAYTAGAHESLTQKIQDTRHAFQNLTTNFGTDFLPTVSKVANAVANLAGWLGRNRSVLYAVLGAVGAVSAILTAHAVIVEVAKAKTYAFAAAQRVLGISAAEAATAEEGATVATIAWGDAMKATVIGAVIFALIELVTHFKQVKQIALDVFHAIITAAKAVGHAISDIWKGITHTGGNILHAATFGLLSSGGVVKPHYFAGGGPVGSDTIPGWLTPGERVLSTGEYGAMGGEAGVQGAIGGGSQILQATIVLKLPNGRELTRAVVQETLNRAARGPSSFVGGSLVTGASGIAP